MMIRPRTALESDSERSEIFSYCREAQKPVFLTENGSGEFVLMSLESYEEQMEMLKLKADLFEAELDFHTNKSYSLDEVSQMMKEIINGVAEAAA